MAQGGKIEFSLLEREKEREREGEREGEKERRREKPDRSWVKRSITAKFLVLIFLGMIPNKWDTGKSKILRKQAKSVIFVEA